MPAKISALPSFQPLWRKARQEMARPRGFEPLTLGLEGRCSIRLSYGRIADSGRGRGIRTPDPLLPKQMRYQTAPCPDTEPGPELRSCALRKSA